MENTLKFRIEEDNLQIEIKVYDEILKKDATKWFLNKLQMVFFHASKSYESLGFNGAAYECGAYSKEIFDFLNSIDYYNDIQSDSQE